MVSVATVVFAALSAVAYALPTTKCATPTLPSTGAPTQLAPPDAGLVLKKIAVGHGIQNYTCATQTTASSPAAIGALAVLYDVTDLYPGSARLTVTKQFWDALPSTLLWSQPLPVSASATAPFPAPKDVKVGNTNLKFLGRHYFDSLGSPTFDLSTVNLKASVKKDVNGGIDAPATADKGPMGTGAVQWLRLIDNGRGLGKGLTNVYRVVTAGGVSPSCDKAGPNVISVPYATYYWFYGPAA
ncbi:hypothetical protein B0H63DRAFT_222285 [Podospora didyma]|uniref:Malate dehydrogenase n=1 Tax=Podospora didyma TaxID=330526 RepID=A0AAE0NBT9_9PEZI|nr:hypothetical protein B0H63DRAFT_222285 [Podospora didyma]